DVTVNIDGTSGTLSGLITNDPTTTRTQLYNRIKAEIRRQLTVILPPSSAVAGIYARVDRNKGVWKSPANEVLNYTIETNTKVTPKRHGELNVVPGSGRSINVIRAIPGRGIRVMGARTLDGNSNEFRYVSVRRLFTFIEQSAKAALLDQVFENNSAVTWLRVKSMIDSFLTRIWRDGALFGAKPEDAFFVNVGRETMSNEDILNGILRVRIGLSAVRPAEFIVLEFSHFIN
ncbi:MAG: phage tail sheath subtilisin-like domain-containing protein, partial [Cyclobacteriaceae bacterium]|nr:phage tail sheath subtilisin-like domain-containing protein [Cyclobacteriaceae bacterium]